MHLELRKQTLVPGDNLIRGHFFIEPVLDYKGLKWLDLFSKKISDSPIIPVHSNKSQIFYHKRLIFNKIYSPSRQFLPSWPRPRSPWLPSATSGVVLNLCFSFFDPNFGYFGKNMIFLGQTPGLRFQLDPWLCSWEVCHMSLGHIYAMKCLGGQKPCKTSKFKKMS